MEGVCYTLAGHQRGAEGLGSLDCDGGAQLNGGCDLGCHEEEILDIAGGLRLTFYDASYVYYAREKAPAGNREVRNIVNDFGTNEVAQQFRRWPFVPC